MGKRTGKQRLARMGILLFAVLIVFYLVSLSGVAIAHQILFRRADASEYDDTLYVTYSDYDSAQYPREQLKIRSGSNILTGYLYGAESAKGLIIISPGHRDANEIKLYETTFFVDKGWQVLCYDYTGCYQSDGNSMNGYTQSVHDLDAVLTYVEEEGRFAGRPILLFGHSLGGYATAAVLQYGHTVNAAVAASGFDRPDEQWRDSVKRYTGTGAELLAPAVETFIGIHYGADASLSAVDGINAVNIPVLVISGTCDEFYGGKSRLYLKKSEVTNPQCSFLLMEEENHNGHYDYFLTDAALSYQDKIKHSTDSGEIDKKLWMQHDSGFMEKLNGFYEDAVD